MSDVEIRPAEPQDLAAVAGLRWEWILEGQGDPGAQRETFVRHFVTWAGQNASSHRCTVLTRDGVVIGMAWLAVVQRVPTPSAPQRASGDLQCVYVAPGERDGGLGGRLIDAVLAHAESLGLERVTVHSSPRAIPGYARRGFEPSPRLLHTHVARADSYP
ncbi:GNAT family N-acetyltransferase [Streptomyces sp. T-3]|nr:GNAT family N-acetyltransferase [Streptomyces sp. T-3]